jgi:hypothetical protein
VWTSPSLVGIGMLRILALDVTDRPSGESFKPHRKILRRAVDFDNLIDRSVSLWDDFEGLSMECQERIADSACITATVVLVAAGFMNRTEPARPYAKHSHHVWKHVLLFQQPPAAIQYVIMEGVSYDSERLNQGKVHLFSVSNVNVSCVLLWGDRTLLPTQRP